MVLDVFCFVLFSVKHFVVNLFSYLIIVMGVLSFLIRLFSCILRDIAVVRVKKA